MEQHKKAKLQARKKLLAQKNRSLDGTCDENFEFAHLAPGLPAKRALK